MKLSTRTRYGIRAMLELAKNQRSAPIKLKTIAQRQGISVKYLEQLATALKSAGLIRSVRGAKGGYMLAKPAGQIRLSDCFLALEGPLVTVECVENKDYCERVADCAVRYVWAKIQNTLMSMLESITLQDIVNKAKDNRKPDYQI